jgi:dihydrofolate synthase / folylpolyglutamate synthase
MRPDSRAIFDAYLEKLNEFKLDFTLVRVVKTLALLKNPQNSFGVIHITGSNGKGSTAAFIEAGLRASGYKTGLYTSPHLLNVNERIAVNGLPVDDNKMAAAGIKLARFLKKNKIRLTYFEFLTVLAFVIFREQGVQAAVIEAGLGGRLDATNAPYAAKLVCVITSISLEHTHYLGNTLKKILVEKEQIIGRGICVVNVPRQLKKYLRSKYGRRVIFADEKFPAKYTSEKKGLKVLVKGYRPIKLRMAEPIQAKNFSAALCALEQLSAMDMFVDIKKALVQMEKTAIRGRFTYDRADYYLSVAHNPEAIREMLKAASLVAGKNKITYVFSVLKDKDLKGICAEIARFPHVQLVLTTIDNARGLSVEKLRDSVVKYKISHVVEADNSRALKLAKKLKGRGILVIGGSFYLVNKYI